MARRRTRMTRMRRNELVLSFLFCGPNRGGVTPRASRHTARLASHRITPRAPRVTSRRAPRITPRASHHTRRTHRRLVSLTTTAPRADSTTTLAPADLSIVLISSLETEPRECVLISSLQIGPRECVLISSLQIGP